MLSFIIARSCLRIKSQLTDFRNEELVYNTGCSLNVYYQKLCGDFLSEKKMERDNKYGMARRS